MLQELVGLLSIWSLFLQLQSQNGNAFIASLLPSYIAVFTPLLPVYSEGNRT